MSTTVRFHGLDQLRAVLMLAGIVYHASLVIGPGSWAYSSQYYNNDALYYAIHVTHFFRMEAFFLLSGFFSALVISRKGVSYFYDGRLKRVLVPLIASIALITSLQTYFMVSHGLMDIDRIYSLSAIMSHTWFLLALFILSSFLMLLPESFYNAISDFSNITKRKSIIGMVFMVFILAPSVLSFFLQKIIFLENIRLAVQYFIITPMHYSLCFLIGFIIYLNDQVKERVLQINKLFLITVFAISASILLYLHFVSFSIGGFSVEVRLLRLLLNFTCFLSASIFLFKVFLSNKFRGSVVTNFLVRSSLVVYLFHHPFLIAIAYFLDFPGLNVWVYFLLVCGLTYLASFIMFLIVNKFTILNKMFGGWASVKVS